MGVTYHNMRLQFALTLLAATDCNPISASVDVDARRGWWGYKGGWGDKSGWAGKTDWYKNHLPKSPLSPASPVSPASSVPAAATPQQTPVAEQLAAKSPSDAQLDAKSPVQSAAQTTDIEIDQLVDNGVNNLMKIVKDYGLEEKLETFKTKMLPKLWKKVMIMAQMKQDNYRKYGGTGYKDENRSLKTAELYIRMIASLVFIFCALSFLCLGCVMAKKAKKQQLIIRQPTVVIPKDEKPAADCPPN